MAKVELRGCPEIGSCAAARTVSKPLRFIKVPVLLGVLAVGGCRWVVYPSKNGMSGQPLWVVVPPRERLRVRRFHLQDEFV